MTRAQSRSASGRIGRISSPLLMYMSVQQWSLAYPDDMTERVEISVKDLRATLADVLNAAAVHGQITWVTNRGRVVAAVVPVSVAEASEAD